MSATLITAIAGLVTALAPIIGGILIYKMKKYEVELKILEGSSASAEQIMEKSQSNFQSFVLSCILVYVLAGGASAFIGVIDNIDSYGEWFLQRDFCLFLGNITVFVMVALRIARNK